MNKFLALVVCVGLCACGNGAAKTAGTASVAQAQQHETKDRVEILYFHGKQRCATCLAIEKNAKEAVEAQFADELKRGTVVFRTIDISKAENEPLAEKYEVAWSSLFVCQWKDGQETYENLTDYAFAHARTAPDTFKRGVIEKVNTLLKLK